MKWTTFTLGTDGQVTVSIIRPFRSLPILNIEFLITSFHLYKLYIEFDFKIVDLIYKVPFVFHQFHSVYVSVYFIVKISKTFTEGPFKMGNL